MMRSASRAATEALRTGTSEAIDGEQSVDGLLELAAQLYSVAELLVDEPRLRRTLGDPASEPARRAALIASILEGKIGASAGQIVGATVSERWSSPWDMTDALETAGDEALFAAAERDSQLDRVVDELFRFERLLDAQSELTTLLDEAVVEPARRVALLDEVLGDKVHVITKALLEHAIRSQRKRTITLAIDDLLEEAAARQARSLARVISAVPLTDEQTSRLAATMSELYAKPITVRTAVVPAVLGGLVIRIGDEVIDGSVASRLIDARHGLAAQATKADTTTRTR
jgi:F-type H+-transporting ATPase subunit delta